MLVSAISRLKYLGSYLDLGLHAALWMSARAGSSRNMLLDVLRGYCFVGMTIEHLPMNPLSAFFRQTYGFLSVAEGFVFIAGIVFAVVYGKTLKRQGTRAMRSRAVARARDIYLNHAGLYTLSLLAGYCAGHQFRVGIFSLWWRGMLMLSQPGLFFLLPMYFVFVLGGALLLEQMLRGRARLVMAGSLAAWLAAQTGLGLPPLVPSWFRPGPFNLLAWQLLFVSGMYFGYRQLEGRQVVPSGRLLSGAAGCLAAVFFLSRHQTFLFGVPAMRWQETAMTTWKYSCHPVRMINFAAVAYVVFYLSSRIGTGWKQREASAALAFIGRHSLPVYGWSVMLTYTAIMLEHTWSRMPAITQAALALAAAISLLIPPGFIRNSGARRECRPGGSPESRLPERCRPAQPCLPPTADRPAKVHG
jgi:hypothetical protein